MNLDPAEIRNVVAALLASGAEIYVHHDGPGTEGITLTPELAVEFVRDLQAFSARCLGITITEYQSWIASAGRLRCSGQTVRGDACRNLVAGPAITDPRIFAKRGRMGVLCTVHGGDSAAEASEAAEADRDLPVDVTPGVPTADRSHRAASASHAVFAVSPVPVESHVLERALRHEVDLTNAVALLNELYPLEYPWTTHQARVVMTDLLGTQVGPRDFYYVRSGGKNAHHLLSVHSMRLYLRLIFSGNQTLADTALAAYHQRRSKNSRAIDSVINRQ